MKAKSAISKKNLFPKYIKPMLATLDKELIALPLFERKNILKKTISENGLLRISHAFEESGIKFFETAKKMGLEGIISKKMDSIYLPGLRSQEWLKIKANKRQEMVIG